MSKESVPFRFILSSSSQSEFSIILLLKSKVLDAPKTISSYVVRCKSFCACLISAKLLKLDRIFLSSLESLLRYSKLCLFYLINCGLLHLFDDSDYASSDSIPPLCVLLFELHVFGRDLILACFLMLVLPIF